LNIRGTTARNYFPILKNNSLHCFCLVSTSSKGSVWESLEQFGNLWNSLGTFGTVWKSLEQFGNLWNSLGTFGTVWKPLDQFGNLWISLGTFVTVWESLEQFGNYPLNWFTERKEKDYVEQNCEMLLRRRKW